MLNLISGVSGSGKSSLKKRVLKRLHPRGFNSQGISTRPKRATEDPATADNIVLTIQEYEERKQSGRMLWDIVSGDYRYGGETAVVDDGFLNDGNHRVMIVVPEVVHIIYEHAYEKGCEHMVLPFFIRTTTPDILRQRMLQRGDALDTIDKRIQLGVNWEREAEQSNIPFIFIPDNDLIEEKLDVILSHLARLESMRPPAA